MTHEQLVAHLILSGVVFLWREWMVEGELHRGYLFAREWSKGSRCLTFRPYDVFRGRLAAEVNYIHIEACDVPSYVWERLQPEDIRYLLGD